MSRVGKVPITVPAGVDVAIDETTVTGQRAPRARCDKRSRAGSPFAATMQSC